MGIPGLLPLLKSIIAPAHLRDYSGKKAAVDTYSWLHKAAFTCSRELCEGEPTVKYIHYCMHRVKLLQYHGVTPLLVFDGGILPMKAEQEAKRARVRKEHLERAREHARCGNNSAAYESYQKAVDITPQVALRLIEVLRQEKVEFIVAPYEADAQMAYLSLNGFADVVITEDSDMIPYGCERVFFKMDKFGQGVEFQYGDLIKNRDLSFSNFTKRMVLEMCILSGCDYLTSLPGMGIKKAHGLIHKFKSYQKVIKHLKFSGVAVSKDYEDKFEKAILTFCHQHVYDPVTENIVHLTEISCGTITDVDFLGPALSQELVQAIAKGLLDPVSHMPFDKMQPMENAAHPEHRQRRISLPAQKNVLTNYFILTSEASKKQFKVPRSSLGSLETARDDPQCITSNCYEITAISSSLDTSSNTMTPPNSIEANFTSSDELGMGLDFLSVPDTPDFMLKFKLDEETDSVPCCDFGRDKKRVCRSEVAKRDASESPKKLPEPPVQAASVLRSKNIYTTEGANGKVVVKSSYFSSAKTKDTAIDAFQENRLQFGTNDVDTREKDEVEKCSHDFSEYKHDDRPRKRSNKRSSLFAEKEKHIPPFNSNLLNGDSSVNGIFASNVSHVEEYVGIAHSSIDKFIATIAPFRCSPGVRASGLRAPTVAKQEKSRDTPKAKSDLDQFALVNFKPRRFGLSRPAGRGAV